MKILFLLSLFLTLIIVRVSSNFLHDKKRYGTKGDKSKTITGLLRRKTGYDWHHIHLGIILFFLALTSIFLNNLTNFNVIILAIGLSLISDQIFPWFGFGNYFGGKMLFCSVMLHLIIAFFVIIF